MDQDLLFQVQGIESDVVGVRYRVESVPEPKSMSEKSSS